VMRKRRRSPAAAVAVLLVTFVVVLVSALPANAAGGPVTIGSDLTASPGIISSCGFGCTEMQTGLPGRQLTAPCDGTITHWRLRGFGVLSPAVPQLQVMHPDGTGKFTATATSAQLVVGTTLGVYEADTSLPVLTGDQIGILHPIDQLVSWTGGAGLGAGIVYVFFSPPAANLPVTPFGPLFGELLFNADITCAPTSPTSKDQCKHGGWRDFPDFKNQGDCVSFVTTDGKNQPG
jgi:hypothetical protein